MIPPKDSQQHRLDNTDFVADSRRDFLKTSSRALGAGLALSTLAPLSLLAKAPAKPIDSKQTKTTTKGAIMQTITLNNGVKMPILGYGVYLVEPKECQRCVEDALSVGYNMIDTAQAYFNEEGVGAAVRSSGIKREALFLVSKIWISNSGYEKAKKSIDESLKKLQTHYLDLMLIHQPFGDYYGTYRAMEEAYQEGKLKAIGLSNFFPDRFVDICNFVKVPPMVNQMETHIFQQQNALKPLLKKYKDVKLMSWSPLARGEHNLFKDQTIAKIGAKYGKSNAQVALRFLIQEGIIAIPKTTNKERMKENLAIFDFSLDSHDMGILKSLDKAKSAFVNHYDPDFVEMIINYGK